MSDDRVIWTPQGYYVPAHLEDRIRAAAEPAPAYRQPDAVLRTGMLGDFIGTPIYILPPPARRPRWWVRAWRWLTRRGRRGT